MPTYAEKNRVKVDPNAIAKVPDLMELMKMIPQSMEALPGVEGLASEVNQFQQGERMNMMERAVPGTLGNFKAAGDQISQMISGSVPKDVQDFLQNNAAAKAMGRGVSGSGLMANDFARTLGLTSLDMINQGIGQMLNMAPVVAGTMTVNPMDVEQNIPNMTDLFNSLYTQETNRSNEVNVVRAANEARRGAAQGSSVGGGSSSSGNPHAVATSGYYNQTPRNMSSLTRWA